MIIFKDIITNDEFFTDSSKYKVIEDDSLYDVTCKVSYLFFDLILNF